MTPEQGDVLIGQVQFLQETVTESVYQSSHLSDQLDLIHQTIATQTHYLIWTFGIIALTLSFVAFLAGFKLARGR